MYGGSPFAFYVVTNIPSCFWSFQTARKSTGGKAPGPTVYQTNPPVLCSTYYVNGWKPGNVGFPIAPESLPLKKARILQDPDLTLFVVGTNQERIKCHSLNLVPNSGYISDLLDSAMKESASQEIKLPEQEPEEFKLFYRELRHCNVKSRGW